MKMIKKFFDKPDELKQKLSDEKILKVIFLCEEKASTAYHLVSPVIITNNAAYVARRGRYNLEGDNLAMRDLFVQVLAKDKNFRDFTAFCAKEYILQYVEEETNIVINLEFLKATDCVSKYEGVTAGKVENVCKESIKNFITEALSSLEYIVP